MIGKNARSDDVAGAELAVPPSWVVVLPPLEHAAMATMLAPPSRIARRVSGRCMIGFDGGGAGAERSAGITRTIPAIAWVLHSG